MLRGRHAAGAYDSLATAPARAPTMMRDFQGVVRDLHLRLSYEPGVEFLGARAAPGGGTVVRRGDALVRRTTRFDGRDSAAIARTNFGFTRVDRLPGNVGYLKFDRFADLDYAGATAVAALAFLANSDAIIVDLRDNIGGSPELLQLVLSYFFGPEPRLYYAAYNRGLDTTIESRTLATVPGRRLPDVDLYVLVGPGTGSAAEAFAYGVRLLKRGTLVGETTSGAGNGGRRMSVGAGLAMQVPEAHVTLGPGWEGTGVAPDVVVPVDSAPLRAHRLALEHLLARDTAADARREHEWGLEMVRAAERPVASRDYARYLGRYGSRSIVVQSGLLYEVNVTGWRSRFDPVAPDVFRDGDDRRLTFAGGGRGHATALTIDYADGRPSTQVAWDR
jgi:hypothetical protein